MLDDDAFCLGAGVYVDLKLVGWGGLVWFFRHPAFSSVLFAFFFSICFAGCVDVALATEEPVFPAESVADSFALYVARITTPIVICSSTIASTTPLANPAIAAMTIGFVANPSSLPSPLVRQSPAPDP